MPAMALAALCLAACSKPRTITAGPDPVPTPTPTTTYDIATVFAANAPTAKTTTIDAAAGGTFTGNGGARYTFPANAFVTAAGLPVTGQVTVRAAEMLTKADMVFSGILPISNGEPLISGGEVYMKVMQGNTTLRMAPGKKYTVSMPQGGAPTPGMELFYAAGAYKSTIGGGVNWQLSKDSTSGIIRYNGDSISIFSDSIGFANADRFLPSPDYQNFTVAVSAGGRAISPDSLIGYTLYDDYDGVWPLSSYNSGVFAENHVPNIPVHFVVVAVINGTMYAGAKGATPANGATYVVNIAAITPTELKALVQAL